MYSLLPENQAGVCVDRSSIFLYFTHLYLKRKFESLVQWDSAGHLRKSDILKQAIGTIGVPEVITQKYGHHWWRTEIKSHEHTRKETDFRVGMFWTILWKFPSSLLAPVLLVTFPDRWLIFT